MIDKIKKLFEFVLTVTVGSDNVFESSRTESAFEVDPEIIKKTVHMILQQMAQLERERVRFLFPTLLIAVKLIHKFLCAYFGVG